MENQPALRVLQEEEEERQGQVCLSTHTVPSRCWLKGWREGAFRKYFWDSLH